MPHKPYKPQEGDVLDTNYDEGELLSEGTDLPEEISGLSDSDNDPVLERVRAELSHFDEDASLELDESQINKGVYRRLAVLDFARRYIEGIEEEKLAGNDLRPTQRMAAIGFERFIASGLLKDELMGHIVHPGGTGKTNVAVMLSKMVGGRTVVMALNKGVNIIETFRAHEETLDEDERRSIGQCFGGKVENQEDIIVTYFESNKGDMDWNSVDLIIVDEADINGLSEARRGYLRELASKHGIPIIGMSATEEQGSGKTIQDVFPHEISRLGMPDDLPRCLRMGITPKMVFSDLTLDLAMGVSLSEIKDHVDIPDESVDDFIRSTTWIELILKHYIENHSTGDGFQPGMIVFRNNKLLEACIAMAGAMGIRAAAYTGDLDDEGRLALQEQLANGEVDLLIGSKLIGRGLHIPKTEVIYNSTVTWSPQLFWQANARGGSIDAETTEKTAHIYAVLPGTMTDKSTGEPFAREYMPLSNATFFEPDFFAELEDRLVYSDTANVLYARGRRRKAPMDVVYDLSCYKSIRSTREVARILKDAREKPVGFISRGAMIARYLNVLENTNITKGLILKIIRMHTAAIRDANLELRRIKEDTQEVLDDLIYSYDSRLEYCWDSEQNFNLESDSDSGSLAEDAQGDFDAISSLEEVAKSAPMLTLSEERRLVSSIKEDPKAVSILIHAYLPLIIEMAKKMCPVEADIGTFVSTGVDGVLHVLSRKKIRGGLSGYVLMISFQRMQRLICDESRNVRLPVYVYGETERAIRMEEDLRNQKRTAEDVTDDEVLKEMGVSIKLPPEGIAGITIPAKELRFAEAYRVVKRYLKGIAAYITSECGNSWSRRKMGCCSADAYEITYEEAAEIAGVKIYEIAGVMKELEHKWEHILLLAKIKDEADARRAHIAQSYQGDNRSRSEFLLLDGDDTKRLERITMCRASEEGFDEEIDSLHAEPTNIHQSLPDHVVAMNQLREITRSVLATLTTREEKVIRQRFGINPGCKDQTLEEVGRDFEVTRDRIRQIEAKSLRKIRHPSRARSLKTFT